MEATRLFLDNQSGNWSECLYNSLKFLRESWSTQWVGLPFVVDACAIFLNLNETTQSTSSAKLLAVARELALQIEADCIHGQLYKEPQYHNRLHLADVLTTMTLQVAIESAHWHLKDHQWQAALILVAIAHDFRHPGRVNHYCGEIEQISVDALRPLLQKNGVSSLWVKRINRIILASDFLLSSQNHKRVAKKSFSWNTDWAIVLLNEADTMTSVSENFGPALSLALSNEWALASLPDYSTVLTAQGRMNFLARTFFSSYSATILGATRSRSHQLSNTIRTI